MPFFIQNGILNNRHSFFRQKSGKTALQSEKLLLKAQSKQKLSGCSLQAVWVCKGSQLLDTFVN